MLPAIEIDGEKLRYRELSAAGWLTPFGKITVLRRTHRGDRVGKGSAVPLDDACGMRGRYMTADVGEMAALSPRLLSAVDPHGVVACRKPVNAARRRGSCQRMPGVIDRPLLAARPSAFAVGSSGSACW